MTKTLEIKSIKEFEKINFYIPSYQRGYRWTEPQVKDLLNDLNAFFKNIDLGSEKYYLLQPIVVKPKTDNSYELVDGQQRLTTIYLILKLLGKESVFKIEYETRKRSKDFLKEISDSENKCNENPDFFRMCEAFHTIKKFFNHNNVDEKFKEKLLENVKFIWYETEEDGAKVFERINIGKIPLTNAELIRAFFLKKIKDNFYLYHKTSNDSLKVSQKDTKVIIEFDAVEYWTSSIKDKRQLEKKQLFFAAQWDRIMNLLRNDRFWAFLFDPKVPKYKRPDEFFRFWLKNKNYGYNKEQDNEFNQTYLFSIFYEKHNDEFWESGLQKVWTDIVQTFNKLENWYFDRQLRFLVGFVLWQDSKELTPKLLTDLLSKYTNKKEFAQDLIERIKSRKFKFEYKENEEESVEKEKSVAEVIKNKSILENLNYIEDYKSIEFILFLHNLAEYYYSSEELEFPFEKFKTTHWSIEHIFARNIENIKEGDNGDLINLLYEIENIIQYLNKQNNSDLDNIQKNIKELIQNLEKQDTGNKINLTAEISRIINQIADINKLWNLTLLSQRANSSLNKETFKEKRKKVLKFYETNEHFIPLATYKVFTKQYSEDTETLTLWLPQDGAQYLKDIQIKLKRFLNIEDNGTE